MTPIELLTQRRSVSTKDMCEPGPTDEQIHTLLKAAHRVPDHGKIGPWRFIVFQGDAREKFGCKLAELYKQLNPDASDKLVDFQKHALMRAPVVIAVISTAAPHPKIPEWEQVLSAGAACQNLLMAAHALGFGAQWLTEWYSYEEQVKPLLNLASEHRVAGFFYIGSYKEKPEERVRPDLRERISYWGS